MNSMVIINDICLRNIQQNTDTDDDLSESDTDDMTQLRETMKSLIQILSSIIHLGFGSRK